MKNIKMPRLLLKASTAMLLVVLIVTSCFSVFAANVGIRSSGATLPQNNNYYLIGGFNNWTETDGNWKLTPDSGNNCYTGTFYLNAACTTAGFYNFKVYNGTNDNYYSKGGQSYGASTTVTTLSNTGADDVISRVTTSGRIKLEVTLYCEYSGDSRLTIKQTAVTVNPGTTVTKGRSDSSVESAGDINLMNDKDSSAEYIPFESTFFDYYTDHEITNGWRNFSSSWGEADQWRKWTYREPYTKFNTAIAQYANSQSSWNYPLYFGDFNAQADGYAGSMGDNASVGFVKYKARANNSQATSAGSSTIDCSVANLADITLPSNKKITSNGVTMPYFDSSWLTGNGYGTVVNSPFPFRKTTLNGDEYYEFDSSNGRDNVFFSGYGTSNFKLNYAPNSSSTDIKYKVWDAKKNFSDDTSTANGAGFFPFDQSSSYQSTNAWNFGFGVRMDIDFTIGKNGLTPSKQHTLFNFTGDDDLWVYLDDVLVLDMGGAHAKAKGCIDFADGKSYVNNIDTTYQKTDGTSLKYVSDTSKTGYSYSASFPQKFGSGSSAFNNSDPNEHHTLTVFYMERGMIESNLKIGFNFAPVTDSLNIDKTVDASAINANLQAAVKSADTFAFNTGSDKERNYSYSKNGDTAYDAVTNENTLTLGDGDNALLKSQYTVDDRITITESLPGKDTLVKYGETENLIFFDPSACEWFMNNSAKPAISLDGTDYDDMLSVDSGGKTIYYYSVTDNSGNRASNFFIGRKTGGSVYNTVKFSASGTYADYNYITSDADWNRNDTTAAYPLGSVVYEKKDSVPTVGGITTLKTGKTVSSGIEYDTTWKVIDTLKEKESAVAAQVASGTGNTAAFTYKNVDNDDHTSTQLKLSYVNKAKPADITVKKSVVDEDGSQISDDNTSFTVTMKFDFDGDGNYDDAPITGTVSQNSPYTFEKLPIGAKYQLVESAASGYQAVTNGTITGTVGATNNDILITNKKLSTKYTPLLKKTLDGESYKGTAFKFTLTGMASQSIDGITTEDTSSEATQEVTTVADGGVIQFEQLKKFTSAGVYCYKIAESKVNADDNDYQLDSDITLRITVNKDATGNLTCSAEYYKDGTKLEGDPTFVNTSTKGKVTVSKTDKLDGDGNPAADADKIQGAEFSIYKVSGENAKPGEGESPVAAVETDENGQVVFDNLDIFASGGNGNNDGKKSYQWYYVEETKAAPGYVLPASQGKWFCFENKTYNSSEKRLTYSFAALNQLITIPQAGINFLLNHKYLLLGGFFLCLGGISGAYVFFKRRKPARRAK